MLGAGTGSGRIVEKPNQDEAAARNFLCILPSRIECYQMLAFSATLHFSASRNQRPSFGAGQMIVHSFPQDCVKGISAVSMYSSIGNDASSVVKVLSYKESSGKADLLEVPDSGCSRFGIENQKVQTTLTK